VKNRNIKLPAGVARQEMHLALGANASLWNEFNPELYTAVVSVQLAGSSRKDEMSSRFGIRSVGKVQQSLLINDRPVFLRGTLECNIFPLTGHPPMTRQGWQKVFTTAKS